MENNNYKKELEIDINDLDSCCVNQPVLFDMYSQKLIPLYKKRDEIKLLMDQTYAKLDGIIRESASAEGKKLTEVKIANEININPQYNDLQIKYLNICNEIKSLEIIKEAFQQRKDMLRLLTELYIAGYWSSVEVKGNMKERKINSIAEKLSEKMKEGK